MAVTSVRPLVAGGGTATTVSGKKGVSFSESQSFKEGASIVVDSAGTPQYFTVDTGAGTAWNMMQAATGSATAAFLCSNESTTMPGARARGGAGSYIIPNAAHFMYRSFLDHTGVQDFYTYLDTLFPENGMHPYTKDMLAGSAGMSALNYQALIPDVGTRIRRIEGILRAASTPGTTLDPDKRIRTLEERVRLLEAEAGGPAPTATVVWTLQQLTDLGDQP